MNDAFSEMPDGVWLQRRLPLAQVISRSNNRDVQARLCAAGVGVAALPRPLGDRTVGIERIDLGEDPPGSRDKCRSKKTLILNKCRFKETNMYVNVY
jgi:hypothetical protein